MNVECILGLKANSGLYCAKGVRALRLAKYWSKLVKAFFYSYIRGALVREKSVFWVLLYVAACTHLKCIHVGSGITVEGVTSNLFSEIWCTSNWSEVYISICTLGEYPA